MGPKLKKSHSVTRSWFELETGTPVMRVWMDGRLSASEARVSLWKMRLISGGLGEAPPFPASLNIGAQISFQVNMTT